MSYWKTVAILVAIVSLLVVTALTINRSLATAGKPWKMKTYGVASLETGQKYVDLGEFLINLSGGRDNQYVKTSISLKLGQSEASTEVDDKVPEIRHHVNLALQSQTVAELSTLEGKSRLAEAIRVRVDYVMGLRKALPSEGAATQPIKLSAVSDVLFTAFIIR